MPQQPSSPPPTQADVQALTKAVDKLTVAILTAVERVK